jgi:predicted nuclease of predicted toxin-antitoxin system
MRFLLDANMPRSAVALLLKCGHEVEFARDIGLQAAPDDQIASHAIQSRAVLLTRDLDFSDVRRYPPEKYPGIVVLRLTDIATASEVTRVLERFLAEPAFLGALSRRLVILEVDRVRFRPPLGQ